MTNPRKKIILNEILFWKQNKLLPEHYCDFLAALYAEGADLEELEPVHHKQAVLPLEKRKWIYLIIGICIAMIALLSIYFTISSLTLILTAVVGIAALILFITAFRVVRKNDLLALVFHLLAAILLFSMSIRIYTTYFNGNNIALFCLIAANCGVWLWSGIKMKLLYFTVSGALGLLALIGYYIINLS
ncbi:hypothetical protein FJQ98_19165 [Lysinibacillus agricola]|uniref:DUF2157 domain-containing protein n=1 Tax=Lysinibacillus agricola TaxID=2590012 RepID=A0ABX7ANF6_9BACI|nr:MULTISPECIES: hypothetical protein [Lysinibacillus]KOS61936.1 hypothetical protein AN161_15395 [Lysinibacillus sp. FJAT-14222]QQP11316.1 hypothetical protein FJQ98_19165 [Lysinibacillus agricola]